MFGLLRLLRQRFQRPQSRQDDDVVAVDNKVGHKPLKHPKRSRNHKLKALNNSISSTNKVIHNDSNNNLKSIHIVLSESSSSEDETGVHENNADSSAVVQVPMTQTIDQPSSQSPNHLERYFLSQFMTSFRDSKENSIVSSPISASKDYSNTSFKLHDDILGSIHDDPDASHLHRPNHGSDNTINNINEEFNGHSSIPTVSTPVDITSSTVSSQQNRRQEPKETLKKYVNSPFMQSYRERFTKKDFEKNQAPVTNESPMEDNEKRRDIQSTMNQQPGKDVTDASKSTVKNRRANKKPGKNTSAAKKVPVKDITSKSPITTKSSIEDTSMATKQPVSDKQSSSYRQPGNHLVQDMPTISQERSINFNAREDENVTKNASIEPQDITIFDHNFRVNVWQKQQNLDVTTGTPPSGKKQLYGKPAIVYNISTKRKLNVTPQTPTKKPKSDAAENKRESVGKQDEGNSQQRRLFNGEFTEGNSNIDNNFGNNNINKEVSHNTSRLEEHIKYDQPQLDRTNLVMQSSQQSDSPKISGKEFQRLQNPKTVDEVSRDVEQNTKSTKNVSGSPARFEPFQSPTTDRTTPSGKKQLYGKPAVVHNISTKRKLNITPQTPTKKPKSDAAENKREDPTQNPTPKPTLSSPQKSTQKPKTDLIEKPSTNPRIESELEFRLEIDPKGFQSKRTNTRGNSSKIKEKDKDVGKKGNNKPKTKRDARTNNSNSNNNVEENVVNQKIGETIININKKGTSISKESADVESHKNIVPSNNSIENRNINKSIKVSSIKTSSSNTANAVNNSEQNIDNDIHRRIKSKTSIHSILNNDDHDNYPHINGHNSSSVNTISYRSDIQDNEGVENYKEPVSKLIDGQLPKLRSYKMTNSSSQVSKSNQSMGDSETSPAENEDDVHSIIDLSDDDGRNQVGEINSNLNSTRSKIPKMEDMGPDGDSSVDSLDSEFLNSGSEASQASFLDTDGAQDTDYENLGSTESSIESDISSSSFEDDDDDFVL